MRRIISILLSALALSAAQAQEGETKPVRPVTSSYMLECGSARIADTYLTPLHYDGFHCGLLYQRAQAMSFNPEKVIMQLSLGAAFNSTENPAKNATMLSAGIDASWSMMRRWQLPANFTVGVGPGVTLDAGVLYLRRNSNNPAQVRASFSLDAVGYATWKHSVFHIPFTIKYQATLPTLGMYFSPDYGQLYYQIYLGDDSNLVHAGWWGNYFMLDNLLTADFHFGCTSLRIGYRGKLFSSKTNGIISNEYSHALVLGITTDWISLRPGRSLPDGKIISAY